MTYDGVIIKPPLDEDTLAHYGVKGMKWGKRKARIDDQSNGTSKRSGTYRRRRKVFQDGKSRHPKWIGNATRGTFLTLEPKRLGRELDERFRQEEYNRYHSGQSEHEARAGKDPTYNTRTTSQQYWDKKEAEINDRLAAQDRNGVSVTVETAEDRKRKKK